MAAVAAVTTKKRSQGSCAIASRKVATRAIEQPMISSAPTSSPQRMLLSSMNRANSSVKGLRGGLGGGGGGTTRGGIGCEYAGGEIGSTRSGGCAVAIGTFWAMGAWG